MNGSGASVKQSILDYVAGSLPLSGLQERMAIAHWNAEMASPVVAKLVYMAVGKLAEYSRGHRSEYSLREELAKATQQVRSDRDVA